MIRDEAKPLPWCSLDASQRSAFSQLTDLIYEAIPPRGHVSKDSAPKRPQWLSEDRSSRVAVLSGHRGIGKTTVLLSLFRAARDPEAAGVSDSLLLAKLTKLRQRVVWLEPLDLEPIPSYSNVLAAILARIEAQFVAEEQEDCECRHDGALDHPKCQRDALGELRRLQDDVGLAWDGNADARKGHVDPDVHARDVMRAERARLSLFSRMRDVLDGLADECSRYCDLCDPLFVVPVDDVDLNPKAFMDVFRYLRLIAVPRLFALVLGDMEVADFILLRDRVVNLGADLPRLKSLDFVERRLVGISQSVAANTLRKLVPSAQRIELKPLSIMESLAFRPHLRAGVGNNADSLGGLLEKFELTRPERPGESLLGMLNTRGQFISMAQAEIPPEELQFPYSARSMFRTTPRRIQDAWHEAQCALAPGISAAEFLARLCRQSVMEDLNTPTEFRDDILAGLSPTSTGNWDLHLIPFRAVPRLHHANTYAYAATPEDAKDHTQLRLHLRPSTGWRLEVGSSLPGTQRPTRRNPALEDDTAGNLIFLHDVLMLGDDARRVHGNLIPAGSRCRWAFSEWRRGGVGVALQWPAPTFRSFFEIDQFMFIWRDALERIDTESDFEMRSEAAMFWWISAGTAVLDKGPLVTYGAGKVGPRVAEWERLRDRLAMLVPQLGDDSRRARLRGAWLTNVALLLMPEFGLRPLPPEPKKMILDILAPRNPVPSPDEGNTQERGLNEYLRRERWQLIRRRRARLLARLKAAGMSALVSRMKQVVSKEFDERLIPPDELIDWMMPASVRRMPPEEEDANSHPDIVPVALLPEGDETIALDPSDMEDTRPPGPAVVDASAAKEVNDKEVSGKKTTRRGRRKRK